MRVAVIDKCPSKHYYTEIFNFDFDLYHLSSVPLTKVLKKDVDIDFEPELYDLVILIGAEAAKEYAKITSVINFIGQIVNNKYICLTNPSMLSFKPEGKPDFDQAVKKIHDIVEGKIPTTTKVYGDFKGIDNVEEAKQFLSEILNSDIEHVGMDTEGTALYPRNGYVLGISFSNRPNYGRYILTDILDDEACTIIQDILNTKTIIFHNLKYDVKMLEYHFGFKFRQSHTHDTMVLHYVLNENASHGLKEIALKHTEYGNYDKDLDDFIKNYCRRHVIKEEDFTWDLIPYEIISPYAAIDPCAALEIFHKFYPIVSANARLLNVYNKLLLRGTFFLKDMEEVGIPISLDRIQAAKVYLEKELEIVKETLYNSPTILKFQEEQGKIFNPGSVQQLRLVLYDYLNLPTTGKLTATGADSTDAEVLEELSELHEIPKLILRTRQLSKIQSTYIDKVMSGLDMDNRLRTSFNLVFTTSGRLSSSGKLNAQQMLRDDPIFKGCIVAPEGYSIVNQDLATGEMYYAAVLSNDKNLQKIFMTGGDFHSSIAKMVFGLPCAVEEVKKKYPALRQSAKAISFGILYGSGAAKVASTVTKATGEYYSDEQAADDIRAYFSKFKDLKKWINGRKKFIKENGFTYSFFGRKRRLSNVFSDDKGIAAHAVRSGVNSEIQSLCSDINLLGAMDAQEEFNKCNIDANIFMLVHDSIVTLVKDEYVNSAKEILKAKTQFDRGCSIPGTPIGVDQEVGKDYSFGKWDELYKFEGHSLSRI